MAGKDLDKRFKILSEKLGWSKDSDESLNEFKTGGAAKTKTPRSKKKGHVSQNKPPQKSKETQQVKATRGTPKSASTMAGKSKGSNSSSHSRRKNNTNKLAAMINLTSDEEENAANPVPAAINNSLNLSDEIQPDKLCNPPAISAFDCYNKHAVLKRNRRSSLFSALDLSTVSTILSQDRRRSKVDDCSFMSMSSFNPVAHSSIYFNPDAHSTMCSVSPDAEESFKPKTGRLNKTKARLKAVVSFSSDSDTDDSQHYVTTVQNNPSKTCERYVVKETDSSDENSSLQSNGYAVPDSICSESDRHSEKTGVTSHTVPDSCCPESDVFSEKTDFSSRSAFVVNDTMDVLNPSGIPVNVKLKPSQDSDSQQSSEIDNLSERLSCILTSAKSKPKRKVNNKLTNSKNDSKFSESNSVGDNCKPLLDQQMQGSTQQLFQRLDNLLLNKTLHKKNKSVLGRSRTHDLSVYGHLVSDSPDVTPWKPCQKGNRPHVIKDSHVTETQSTDSTKKSKLKKPSKSRKLKDLSVYGNLLAESPPVVGSNTGLKQSAAVIHDSVVPDTELSDEQIKTTLKYFHLSNGGSQHKTVVEDSAVPDSEVSSGSHAYHRMESRSHDDHLGIVPDSEVPDSEFSSLREASKIAGVSLENGDPFSNACSSVIPETQIPQIHKSKPVDINHISPESMTGSEITTPSSGESASDFLNLTMNMMEKAQKRREALDKSISKHKTWLCNVGLKTKSPINDLFDVKSGTASHHLKLEASHSPVHEGGFSDVSMTDVSLQVSLLDSEESDLSVSQRDLSLQVSLEGSVSDKAYDNSAGSEDSFSNVLSTSPSVPGKDFSLQVSLNNEDLSSGQSSAENSAEDFSDQLSVLSNLSSAEAALDGDDAVTVAPPTASQEENALNLYLSISTQNNVSQNVSSGRPVCYNVSSSEMNDVGLQVTEQCAQLRLDENCDADNHPDDIGSSTDKISHAFGTCSVTSPCTNQSSKQMLGHMSLDSCEQGDISSEDSHSNSSLYRTAIFESSHEGEQDVHERSNVVQKSHNDRRRTIEVFHSFNDDDDSEDDNDDEDSNKNIDGTTHTMTSAAKPHQSQIIILSDSESDSGSYNLGKIRAAYQNLDYADKEDDSIEEYVHANPRAKAGVTTVLPHANTEKKHLESDEALQMCHPSSDASESEHEYEMQKSIRETESSEDDFEEFIKREKAKKNDGRREITREMSDFIVNDDEDSDIDDDEVFHVRINNTAKTPKTPRRRYTICEDENGVIYRTPRVPPPKKQSKTTGRKPRTPVNNLLSPGRRPLSLVLDRNDNSVCNSPSHYSFLRSLSDDVPNVKKHPDAIKFVSNFKRHREELTARLFKLYNETVFDNQLPQDMTLTWNSRMTKTAGFCTYSKNNSTGLKAAISLSNKVCDSAARVRDTVIHEMCHAAVWLIHGRNDHHGPYWQTFARKANRIHSELPVIGRCHSYEIKTRYTYRCMSCGYEIGRHSKSLDTAMKVCGLCRGTFELLVNCQTNKGSIAKTPRTPRTPNAFALFVKEHYSAVKQRNQSSKHKDVMQALSAEFAAKNRFHNDLGH